MVRRRPQSGDLTYEASNGKRKRAEDTVDRHHLMRCIGRAENADEDYTLFLKFVYGYHKNSQAYTNKVGKDGSTDHVDVVDVNDNDDDDDDDDDDDEAAVEDGDRDREGDGVVDEDDPQYKIFLANAKPDGRSYVVKLDTEDASFMFIKYEKEYGCNLSCEHLHVEKHEDIEVQKEQIMKKRGKPVDVMGNKKPSNIDGDYKNLMEKHDWGMKTSSKGGCHFEYEAAKDDAELVTHATSSVKRNDSKNLRSEFRKEVADLLKKPYSPNEYENLWAIVSHCKPVQRNIDLRGGRGGFYETQKMGKSYLDHYEDLCIKLKEADNDKRKQLKILRAFFFWLQNLTREGAFKPWNDAEFLAMVAETS